MRVPGFDWRLLRTDETLTRLRVSRYVHFELPLATPGRSADQRLHAARPMWGAERSSAEASSRRLPRVTLRRGVSVAFLQ